MRIDENDIDETTGLPRVPKGYFWRVSSTLLGDARVELRKKGVFGSHDIKSRLVGGVEWMIATDPKEYKEYDTPQGRILLTAKRVAEAVNEEHDSWEKSRKFEALYGDYPPNTLNN